MERTHPVRMARHARSRTPGLLLIPGRRKTLVCLQFPLLLCSNEPSGLQTHGHSHPCATALPLQPLHSPAPQREGRNSGGADSALSPPVSQTHTSPTPGTALEIITVQFSSSHRKGANDQGTLRAINHFPLGMFRDFSEVSH